MAKRTEISAAELGSRSDALRHTVLDSEGATPTALREEVFRWAIGTGPTPAVSEAATRYLGKVVRHAHRITDEDVRGLYDEGLGNAEIFELTVAAALGAAAVRLESGLAALATDDAE